VLPMTWTSGCHRPIRGPARLGPWPDYFDDRS
jgi:hypothetical protein